MLIPYSILIAFICAAMNHMGLIATAEKVLHCKLPVLNCPRCSAFWLTLGFLGCHGMTTEGTVVAVAVAFAAAYLAIWMELLMGGIDRLYMMLYDKIYPTAAGAADDTPAAEREGSDAKGGSSSDDAVPEVRIGPATDAGPNS
jgi:hypothetical protein